MKDEWWGNGEINLEVIGAVGHDSKFVDHLRIQLKMLDPRRSSSSYVSVSCETTAIIITSTTGNTAITNIMIPVQSDWYKPCPLLPLSGFGVCSSCCCCYWWRLSIWSKSNLDIHNAELYFLICNRRWGRVMDLLSSEKFTWLSEALLLQSLYDIDVRRTGLQGRKKPNQASSNRRTSRSLRDLLPCLDQDDISLLYNWLYDS